MKAFKVDGVTSVNQMQTWSGAEARCQEQKLYYYYFLLFFLYLILIFFYFISIFNFVKEFKDPLGHSGHLVSVHTAEEEASMYKLLEGDKKEYWLGTFFICIYGTKFIIV